MPEFNHDDCGKKIEQKLGCKLTQRESRRTTIHEDQEREITVVILISTEHDHNTPKSGDAGFPLNFCLHHKTNLLRFENGYVGLGCGSEDSILLFPQRDFFKILDILPSVRDEGLDYFIRVERRSGEYFIDTRNPDVGFISVQKYLI